MSSRATGHGRGRRSQGRHGGDGHGGAGERIEVGTTRTRRRGPPRPCATWASRRSWSIAGQPTSRPRTAMRRPRPQGCPCREPPSYLKERHVPPEALFGVDKPLIAMCHLRSSGPAPLRRAGGMDAIVERRPRPRGAAGRRRRRVIFCNEQRPALQLARRVEAAATMAAWSGRCATNHACRTASTCCGTRGRASPWPRRPEPRSCARCSPASTTATWGCSRPTTAHRGYQQAIDAADVASSPMSPRVQPVVGGRTVAERAAARPTWASTRCSSRARRPGSAPAWTTSGRPRPRRGRAVLANTGVRRRRSDVLAVADGAIVGTSMKVGGDTWKAVDPARVVAMMEVVWRVRGELVAMARKLKPSSPPTSTGPSVLPQVPQRRHRSTGRTSWSWAATSPARRSRRSTTWAAAAGARRSAATPTTSARRGARRAWNG